jgi:hypothetical protein
MKKSRYTEEHIAFALKQAETGPPVNSYWFCRWRMLAPRSRPGGGTITRAVFTRRLAG